MTPMSYIDPVGDVPSKLNHMMPFSISPTNEKL